MRKLIWNTEKPGYRQLHYWVEKNLGKPSKCENCGVTDAPRFHWSNVSGEYKKELTDWIRLCVPCHSKKDGAGKQTKAFLVYCRKGLHKRTPDNIYTNPSGIMMCRKCRAISTLRSYNKKKAELKK